VVDLPTLVALKKAAGRPQDRVMLLARSPEGPHKRHLGRHASRGHRRDRRPLTTNGGCAFIRR